MVRIPKYAKAQLLCEKSNGTISQALLNRVDRKHPGMIHTLFECATQTTEGTYLPRPMLSKVMSMEVFALRIEALGNLPATWRARGGITDDGDVIPWHCSAFSIVFDQAGKATQLKYHGGSTAQLEQTINITSQYEVLDPLQPMNATLRCGAVRIALYGLFAANDGPM